MMAAHKVDAMAAIARADVAQEVVLHGPHIALGESATTS